MSTLNVHEILEATGGRLIYGNPGAVFTGVSADSRTVKAGELFVPLKGERFDGHDFLLEALREGGGAVVSRPPAGPAKGRTIILVKNTLKALQNIAHYRRVKSGATVVGITGTNGKTTTKELTAAILGISHRTLKNQGNLNNHIGLPLSLVKITPEDEFAVLEMGASLQGDIRQLCRIAAPDCGIITNIGSAHLEGFGSIEGVRSTKLELFEAVRRIVVNADDAFLMEGVRRRAEGPDSPSVTTFGISEKADVTARDIVFEERRSVFTLCTGKESCAGVALSVPGRFNISNALAAAAICAGLGIWIEDIKRGIESFTGVPMRLELRDFLGAAVISDVYNANPVSMEEALKELVRLKKGRAIAVLGDMLELGSYAEDAHRKLGRWMADMQVDIFIAVGPLMAMAAEEFSASRVGSIVASDPSEARRVLLGLCTEGDTVLVKGSRGTRMERVLWEHPEGPVLAGSEARDAV